MIAGIHISQEIFAIDVLTAFRNFFGASSEACSAIVTTIWTPGFSVRKMFLTVIRHKYNVICGPASKLPSNNVL